MSGVTKPIATDETLQRIAEALDAKDTTQNRIDEINAISEEKKQEIEIVGEQVKSTIPDDYSILTEKVNNMSNAIKGKVCGSIVRVDDVSPVEHELDVRVRSKNLIPYPYQETTKTINGITFTDNGDGSVTANGTATGQAYFVLYRGALPAGTYFLSGSPYFEEAPSNVNIYIANADYQIYKVDTGGGVMIKIEDEETFSITIQILEGATVSGLTFKPQLELGLTPTEYTPYVDPSTVKVIRSGKNMLINKKGNATINDIEWTVNENGTLNASGTTTNSDYYFFGSTVENEDSFVAPCDLVLSSNYEMDNNNVFGARTSAGLIHVMTNTKNIVIPAGTRVDGVFLRVYNKTLELQNIECQMEIGTEKTAYEPCRWQSALADKDGTIKGVTSLAPTMILMADKENVSIDLTYNKDTNKVIEKLINAIISLGGNV